MQIYKTASGNEYDLAQMSREHKIFLKRAYWHYCTNMAYEDFIFFILGPNSPVLNLKKNGPKPTNTPLYDITTDLQGRLGVKQGLLSKDWEGDIDPLWPLTD